MKEGAQQEKNLDKETLKKETWRERDLARSSGKCCLGLGWRGDSVKKVTRFRHSDFGGKPAWGKRDKEEGMLGQGPGSLLLRI